MAKQRLPHKVLEQLFLDLPEKFTTLEREQFEDIISLDSLKEKASEKGEDPHLHSYLVKFISASFKAEHIELIVKLSKLNNLAVNGRILQHTFRGRKEDKELYQKLVAGGLTPNHEEVTKLVDRSMSTWNFKSLTNGLASLKGLYFSHAILIQCLSKKRLSLEDGRIDPVLSILLPDVTAPVTEPNILKHLNRRIHAGNIDISYTVTCRFMDPEQVRELFISRDKLSLFRADQMKDPKRQGKERVAP